MIFNNNEIISKKYILLDWNVIKYLKKPRNSSDVECNDLIEQIRKRYEFPFCESHLHDLAKSYSESNINLVNADLDFLQLLSDSVVIGVDEENESFRLVKYSPAKLFQEIINESPSKPNITSEMNPQSIFKVDMQELAQDHPMRSMLEKTGGVYGPGIMANWMNSLFELLFNEIDDYKQFREYVKKLKMDLENENSQGFLTQSDLAYKNFLLQHMMPFIDSLEIEKKDELVEIWKDVITKWLQMRYQKEVPFGELITTAYVMLDFHTLFKEKLKKKKNTLSNITRDSKMIYYAAFSKYFVTEDKECLDKTEFIFQAFKCDAKVINMEQFLKKFS